MDYSTARKRLENELRQGLLPLEQNDGTEARQVAVASGDLFGIPVYGGENAG